MAYDNLKSISSFLSLPLFISLFLSSFIEGGRIKKSMISFFSTFFLIFGIYTCSFDSYSPTYFFIAFSAIIILGDMFLSHDKSKDEFKYPQLINLPIYLNLFLLLIFILNTVFIFGNSNANWFSNVMYTYLNIDLVYMRESIKFIDKFSLIAIVSLFIGIMGTVPGHELTHRKREKVDMFFGNWLLSLSWDCTFAIEHVYGHHKNVCLPIDPATAKRGESIYLFISERRDSGGCISVL